MGRRDKPERNDRFDRDCRLVTEKNNKAYKKMIQNRFIRTAEKEYKQTRKEEKKIHREKEREYYNNKQNWNNSTQLMNLGNSSEK